MHSSYTRIFGRLAVAGLLAGTALNLAAGADTLLFNGQLPAAEKCADGLLSSDNVSRALLKACDEAVEDSHLPVADQAATFQNAGIAYMRSGDTETALDLFARAEASGHDLPSLDVNIAAALLRQEDAQGALDRLANAEAIDPQYRHIAFYNRALAHLMLEDAESAYEDLRAAEALRPDYSPASHALAQFTVETH